MAAYFDLVHAAAAFAAEQRIEEVIENIWCDNRIQYGRMPYRQFYHGTSQRQLERRSGGLLALTAISQEQLCSSHRLK